MALVFVDFSEWIRQRVWRVRASMSREVSRVWLVLGEVHGGGWLRRREPAGYFSGGVRL